MELVRSTLQELRKNLYIPFLLVGVAGVLLLMLTGTLYTDNHYKSHLIIQFLFEKNREQIITKYSLNAYMVLRSGTGTWFYEFLPAFLVVGYMFTLSAERNNGELKFMMLRESIPSYCISKLLALMLSGGVVTLTAASVYAFMAFGIFPGKKGIDENMLEVLKAMFGVESIESAVYVWLFEMFIVGMFAVVPGYLAGMLFNDRYMLICVPVLINYFYSQVLQKIEMLGVEKGKYDIYDKTEPYKLSNLLCGAGKTAWFKTLMIYAVVSLIMLICFCLITNLHRKRGTYA